MDNITEILGNMNDMETNFCIDSPEKADWAIRKIKEDKQRHDVYVSTCENEIAFLQEKIKKADEKLEMDTAYLEEQLNQFLDVLPAKETKTQLSFELPNGKMVRKKATQTFEKTEELLGYCEETAPEYVKEKITKTVDWVALKKNLIVENGAVVNKETGEIVEGVNVVEKPESFEVK